MSEIYRRVMGDERPAWAAVGSIGRFRIEPETDWDGRDDDEGRYLMGRFQPHYHHGDEYWLIASGSGVVRIGTAERRFRAGDIVCIEGGKVHDVPGVFEPVEGFWFEALPPDGQQAGHFYVTPEDERGHVVQLLAR